MTQSPRIPPLPLEEWTDEQRKLVGPLAERTNGHNVIGLYVKHWDAFKARRAWSAHVLGPTSTLTPRERELLIMRTGYVADSEYEWAQHKQPSLDAGISLEEIERIKLGGSADGWTETEAVLLDLTDELVRTHTLSDPVWERLTAHLSTQQVMDAIFTVTHYLTVAIFLRSLNVQIDPGHTGYDPDKVF